MDTILMNSENSRTFVLKLTEKLNLRTGQKKYCFIKS